MTSSVKAFVILIALGLCFFGSLLLAAQFFPHRYEWKKTVISSLASPRDNPRAYGIACAGLAMSGLLLIPCTRLVGMRLTLFASGSVRWGDRFFYLASICLVFSALIVPGHYRFFGISRWHEHLAQVSAIAFCLALGSYLRAVLRFPQSQKWLQRGLIALVTVPVTAVTASRVSLLFAEEYLSPIHSRAIKELLWNSLAFWEWFGAVCIYVFLWTIIIGLREAPCTEAMD